METMPDDPAEKSTMTSVISEMSHEDDALDSPLLPRFSLTKFSQSEAAVTRHQTLETGSPVIPVQRFDNEVLQQQMTSTEAEVTDGDHSQLHSDNDPTDTSQSLFTTITPATRKDDDDDGEEQDYNVKDTSSQSVIATQPSAASLVSKETLQLSQVEDQSQDETCSAWEERLGNTITALCDRLMTPTEADHVQPTNTVCRSHTGQLDMNSEPLEHVGQKAADKGGKGKDGEKDSVNNFNVKFQAKQAIKTHSVDSNLTRSDDGQLTEDFCTDVQPQRAQTKVYSRPKSRHSGADCDSERTGNQGQETTDSNNEVEVSNSNNEVEVSNSNNEVEVSNSNNEVEVSNKQADEVRTGFKPYDTSQTHNECVVTSVRKKKSVRPCHCTQSGQHVISSGTNTGPCSTTKDTSTQRLTTKQKSAEARKHPQTFRVPYRTKDTDNTGLNTKTLDIKQKRVYPHGGLCLTNGKGTARYNDPLQAKRKKIQNDFIKENEESIQNADSIEREEQSTGEVFNRRSRETIRGRITESEAHKSCGRDCRNSDVIGDDMSDVTLLPQCGKEIQPVSQASRKTVSSPLTGRNDNEELQRTTFWKIQALKDTVKDIVTTVYQHQYQADGDETGLVERIRRVYDHTLFVQLTATDKASVIQTMEKVIRQINKRQQEEKTTLAGKVKQGKMTSAEKVTVKKCLHKLSERCAALQKVFKVHQQLKKTVQTGGKRRADSLSPARSTQTKDDRSDPSIQTRNHKLQPILPGALTDVPLKNVGEISNADRTDKGQKSRSLTGQSSSEKKCSGNFAVTSICKETSAARDIRQNSSICSSPSKRRGSLVAASTCSRTEGIADKDVDDFPDNDSHISQSILVPVPIPKRQKRHRERPTPAAPTPSPRINSQTSHQLLVSASPSKTFSKHVSGPPSEGPNQISEELPQIASIQSKPIPESERPGVPTGDFSEPNVSDSFLTTASPARNPYHQCVSPSSPVVIQRQTLPSPHVQNSSRGLIEDSQRDGGSDSDGALKMIDSKDRDKLKTAVVDKDNLQSHLYTDARIPGNNDGEETMDTQNTRETIPPDCQDTEVLFDMSTQPITSSVKNLDCSQPHSNLSRSDNLALMSPDCTLDSDTVLQDPAPMSQDSAPLSQDSAPMSQDSAPVSQNSAPVSQNSAPLIQDFGPISQSVLQAYSMPATCEISQGQQNVKVENKTKISVCLMETANDGDSKSGNVPENSRRKNCQTDDTVTAGREANRSLAEDTDSNTGLSQISESSASLGKRQRSVSPPVDIIASDVTRTAQQLKITSAGINIVQGSKRMESSTVTQPGVSCTTCSKNTSPTGENLCRDYSSQDQCADNLQTGHASHAGTAGSTHSDHVSTNLNKLRALQHEAPSALNTTDVRKKPTVSVENQSTVTQPCKPFPNNSPVGHAGSEVTAASYRQQIVQSGISVSHKLTPNSLQISGSMNSATTQRQPVLAVGDDLQNQDNLSSSSSRQSKEMVQGTIQAGVLTGQSLDSDSRKEFTLKPTRPAAGKPTHNSTVSQRQQNQTSGGVCVQSSVPVPPAPRPPSPPSSICTATTMTDVFPVSSKEIVRRMAEDAAAKQKDSSSQDLALKSSAAKEAPCAVSPCEAGDNSMSVEIVEDVNGGIDPASAGLTSTAQVRRDDAKQLQPRTKIIVMKKVSQHRTAHCLRLLQYGIQAGPEKNAKTVSGGSQSTSPRFRHLLNTGAIRPGKLNLSITLKGCEKKASILEDGRIEDLTGLTFCTPLSWYKAVTSRTRCKPSSAYDMIRYNGRPLAMISDAPYKFLDHQTPDPKQPTNVTRTSELQPSATPVTTAKFLVPRSAPHRQTGHSSQAAGGHGNKDKVTVNCRPRTGTDPCAAEQQNETPEKPGPPSPNSVLLPIEAAGSCPQSSAAIIASLRKLKVIEENEVALHRLDSDLASFWGTDFAKLAMTPRFWATADDWD